MADNLGERVFVDVPGNTGSPIQLEIIRKNKFNHGGGKDKYKVDGNIIIDEETKLPIQLVQRNFGVNTERIFKTWEYCHYNNGPVIPIMAKADNGDVLMPDLEADGSTLYGRGVNAYMEGGHGELRRFEPRDNVFLEIMKKKENVIEIEKLVDRNIKWFTDHDVRIAMDDPFELIVHPDGSFEVISLDLEQTLLTPTDNEKDKEVIMESNLNSKDSFMRNLSDAYKKLTTLKDKPHLKTISQIL